MATFTKLPLSGSTNGKQITIAAITGSTPTELHTAIAGTTDWDEVWIYASNYNSSSLTASIQWGGQTKNDAVHTIINPSSGRVLIADGKLINNSLVVSAYASVNEGIVVDGFINRIEA